MGSFAAGQVVLVYFPFSDLTSSKLRPAVVLADVGRDDWVLCQVTSNSYGDARAIGMESADFTSGSLHRASFARPGKLFTAHASLIAGRAGVLNLDKFSAIRDAVVSVISND